MRINYHLFYLSVTLLALTEQQIIMHLGCIIYNCIILMHLGLYDMFYNLKFNFMKVARDSLPFYRSKFHRIEAINIVMPVLLYVGELKKYTS
jgi:hypothetical protein